MSRVLRATGTVFIALGVLILYFVVYELFGTSLQTHAHQRALKHEFATELAEPRATIVAPTGSPTPAAARPHRSAVRGIAELRIPKVGLDVIVVEGIALSDLQYGPGHYPDSAAIGGKGTTAIAGHRTGWGGPFFNLDKLRTGDRVILETVRGTFTYQVTRSVVVQPTDYWVIDGDPQSKAPNKLTLSTCTPRYTAKERLIVWADLIASEPRAA